MKILVHMAHQVPHRDLVRYASRGLADLFASGHDYDHKVLSTEAYVESATTTQALAG